ncbi:MAG: alpha/beta fold hydrolase [Pseudomonadota bacterium]
MRSATVLLLVAQLAFADANTPAPLTVDALRQLDVDVTFTVEGDLDAGPGFTAYLVSYRHAGLKLHAMVAVPTGEAPDGGFPVVVANHGYVPDPRRYGITADGRDSRPGDYYRSVPALFTSRGFLTVMADYRGHNSSEGYDMISPQTAESFAFYAEDVVALMSALDQLETADTDNVFVWGHSMGGLVTLKALLATDGIRAASLWSTMDVAEYAARIGDLDIPVNVHHASGDQATAVSNSRQLADWLDAAGRLAGFYEYDSVNHYFDESRRESAADLDADLFRSRLQ